MIVNTYCALFPPIPLCIRLDKGLQRYTIFKNFSSLIDLFLDTFHCFAVIRAESPVPTYYYAKASHAQRPDMPLRSDT